MFPGLHQSSLGIVCIAVICVNLLVDTSSPCMLYPLPHILGGDGAMDHESSKLSENKRPAIKVDRQLSAEGFIAISG